MTPNIKYLKGPSEAVANTPISDGQILLATDTAELFIDHGLKRIKIGSGATPTDSQTIKNIVIDRPPTGVHLLLKYTENWGTYESATTYIDTYSGENIDCVKCIKADDSGNNSWIEFPTSGCTDESYSDKVAIDLSNLPIESGMLYYNWADSNGILSNNKYVVYPSLYFPDSSDPESSPEYTFDGSIKIPAYSTNFILKAGNVTNDTESITNYETVADTENSLYSVLVNIPGDSIAASEGEDISIINSTEYNVFLSAFLNEQGNYSDYAVHAIPEYRITNKSNISSINLKYFWVDDYLTTISQGDITLPIANLSDCEYVSIIKPSGATHLKIRFGSDVLVDTYNNVNINSLKYCLYSGNSITWTSPQEDEGVPSVSDGYPVFFFIN